MSIELNALQQLIKDVQTHRDQTEQEMDAIAQILEHFGKRLVALETTVDKLEQSKALPPSMNAKE
jgi:ferritin-like metal-binding protein YciE